MAIINNAINNKIGGSNSGSTNTLTIDNASNTASSAANVLCTVGGGTADDATYQAVVSGVTTWTWGVDNSDSDSYVIAASGTLGTTNVMRASTTGYITTPLQCCFSYYNNTDVTGLTKGTDNTTAFNTKIFDQNNNFSSNTFTAPVTGKYLLNTQVALGTNNSATRFLIKIVTTSNSYEILNLNPTGINEAVNGNIFGGAVIANMSAGDTATVVNFVSGGTSTYTILGATFIRTKFMGELLA